MIAEKDRLKEIQELDKKGNITETETKLIEYLNDYPDSVIATFMLAGLYYTQELYNKAEPLYKKIPKDFPKYPTALISLFHILWKKNSKKEAINLIKTSLDEADKNDPEWELVIQDFIEIKKELIEKEIWLEKNTDVK